MSIIIFKVILLYSIIFNNYFSILSYKSKGNSMYNFKVSHNEPLMGPCIQRKSHKYLPWIYQIIEDFIRKSICKKHHILCKFQLQFIWKKKRKRSFYRKICVCINRIINMKEMNYNQKPIQTINIAYTTQSKEITEFLIVFFPFFTE